jgi:hypothetical protein
VKPSLPKMPLLPPSLLSVGWTCEASCWLVWGGALGTQPYLVDGDIIGFLLLMLLLGNRQRSRCQRPLLGSVGGARRSAFHHGKWRGFQISECTISDIV